MILTPLFQAVLLRKMPRKSTLLGAAIALGGLWLLSGIGAASGGWVLGDTLVVICAVAYSVHMIVLGSTREVHDVMALTFVQLATVTVVCTVISAVKEQPGLPTDPAVIWAIVITGVLASALAFVIQTWAQSKLPPARVALILVMEPAFGGLIGWAVAGLWPIREVLGAAAMLVGHDRLGGGRCHGSGRRRASPSDRPSRACRRPLPRRVRRAGCLLPRRAQTGVDPP